MGGCGTSNGIFGRYCNFVMKLQDADKAADAAQSVVAMFDSLLSEVNRIAPAAGRVMMNTTGAGVALERVKLLSEIDRQLFLQFLQLEIIFLRKHPTIKTDDLWKRVHHDISVSHKKQKQIRAALTRILSVEGIDASFSTALVAQRMETLKTFTALNVMPKEWVALMTLDDFLNNREAKAVKKIMEQLLQLYADEQLSTVFSADAAWWDLRHRWDGWASKHRERIAAFKELWKTTEGGRDINSNPSGIKIIDGYYQQLYAQIEGGSLASLIAVLSNFNLDPWAN